MIAQLWANQIIAGDKTYKQVPAKLKEAVKQILISTGHGDLVIE